MITEQEALDEFLGLINDDPDFENQWSNTSQDFFEWCSLYDDLKHIKQREVA
jgi:hypothetical protein